MTGGVDEVQDIFLPVLRAMGHPDGLGLDRDPALPFEVHLVQKLIDLLPIRKGAGDLEEPVRQGRLPVVDVGDDGKIADVLYSHVYQVPEDFTLSRKYASVRASPSSNETSGYHPNSLKAIPFSMTDRRCSPGIAGPWISSWRLPERSRSARKRVFTSVSIPVPMLMERPSPRESDSRARHPPRTRNRGSAIRRR